VPYKYRNADAFKTPLPSIGIDGRNPTGETSNASPDDEERQWRGCL
jgi:hypothetical protein